MIDRTTKVIACNLKVILAMDKHYKLSMDKKMNLFVSIPVSDKEHASIQVIECSFMPNEDFVRFESMTDFNLWRFKKESLASLCKNGALQSHQI